MAARKTTRSTTKRKSTTKRTTRKRATPAQKAHQKRFARASKKCSGMTKTKRTSCMRKALRK